MPASPAPRARSIRGNRVFTILSGTTAVGSAVTVNVAAGTASASYNLPAGTAVGTYTIQSVYNGTANFLGSIDSAHQLTVSAASAPTTAAATNASATLSSLAQSVSLSADIHSSSGTVNREPRPSPS